MSVPDYPELDYPFETPEDGAVTEVAPGVKWLRMPLQLTGLNHINLWLVADDEGWTAVDTGMNAEPIRQIWEQVFETALEGRPVVRVLCTHFHPDHMGLAGWLCERWGVRLWATRREWLMGRVLYLEHRPDVPEFFLEHYRKVGFNAEALQAIASRGYSNYARSVTPIPEQFRRIVDGETVVIGEHGWRVICGYGHAPEHACLHCPELGVMISGDQVLPRITPHIGVYPSEPDANPLQEYIDSLENYRHVPADTLILPAHGLPFRGLHDRLDFLHRHHEDRLKVLEAMLDEPKRVTSTLKVLYGRMLKPFETFLGVGESLAHLNCLIAMGRVERTTDAEGVWLFRRTRADADARAA